MEVIRDFLIEYDKIAKLIDQGEPYEFVYMDESYCHNTHASSDSWAPTVGDTHVNRSTSKGKRLCIIHAITKDGPMCEYDDNG